MLFTGTPADPGLAQAQFVVLYRGSGSLEYGNVDVSACAELPPACASPAGALLSPVPCMRHRSALRTYPPPALPCAWQVLSRAPGRDVVRLRGSADSPGAELTLIITLTATRATNPLRALRVVPAGAGICAGDPFTPAPAPSACGNPARFRSFEAHHASILFNPQFLQGLRRYR